MKQIRTLAVLALSMGMSVSAVAAPPDALINNNLSLPGEMTKSIMLDNHISEARGEVWPIILVSWRLILRFKRISTAFTYPQPEEAKQWG